MNTESRDSYYANQGDKTMKMIKWYNVGITLSKIRADTKNKIEIGRQMKRHAAESVAVTTATDRSNAAWMVENWGSVIEYVSVRTGIADLKSAEIEIQCGVIAENIGFSPRTICNHVKGFLKERNVETG